MVTSDQASGSICGFSQNTPITCTVQAQNSLGFGAALMSAISTTETVTDITQSENNGKL